MKGNWIPPKVFGTKSRKTIFGPGRTFLAAKKIYLFLISWMLPVPEARYCVFGEEGTRRYLNFVDAVLDRGLLIVKFCKGERKFRDYLPIFRDPGGGGGGGVFKLFLKSWV